MALSLTSTPHEARAALLQAVTRVGMDVNTIDALVGEAVRYSSATAAERALMAPAMQLESRWYESLQRGVPDFGVYDTPWYIAESFACWQVYSRKYLRLCESKGVFASVAGVMSVADLGCGIGITTAALAQRFPQAKVVGTNLPGTAQYAIAAELAEGAGFTMADDVHGHADIVFASEFFEHIEDPVAYLALVLQRAQPRLLIVANTFNAPAIGHFTTYKRNGAKRNGIETARDFSAFLKSCGYVNERAWGFWNARPQVWRRLASQ